MYTKLCLLIDDILTSLSGEDPEAVVPEAGGDEEPGVDGRYETVAARAHSLREVVAQLTPRQRLGTAGRYICIYINFVKKKN